MSLCCLILPARDYFVISFVGDIESMPFIEALRQLSFSVGKVDFMCSINFFLKNALYVMIDLDLNVLFCCIIYIQLILTIEYTYYALGL
jgi:hypothetical protein